MARIKKYGDFTTEAISGTEVPTNPNFSYFGAAYGTHKSPNTIDQHDTNLVYSKLLGRPVSEDEFDEIYTNYLSTSRDKSIVKEFTGTCIDTILHEMS